MWILMSGSYTSTSRPWWPAAGVCRSSPRGLDRPNHPTQSLHSACGQAAGELAERHFKFSVLQLVALV